MECQWEADLRRIHKRFVSLLLLVPFVGCIGSPVGAQRWSGGQFGQGSVERQKGRSVYFDPYPLNDLGPEVVGGRPRGFTDPLPEAKRNELTARPYR
jgi:hypothetical protein